MVPFSDAYINALDRLQRQVRKQIGVDIVTGVEDSFLVFQRTRDGHSIELVASDKKQAYQVSANPESLRKVGEIVHGALAGAGLQLEEAIRQGGPYVQVHGYPASSDEVAVSADCGIVSDYVHTDHDVGIQEFATAPGNLAHVANTVNYLRSSVREALRQHGFMCIFQSENLADVYQHYALQAEGVPFKSVRDVLAWPMQFNHSHITLSLKKGDRTLFDEQVNGRYHILHTVADRIKDHPEFGDGDGIKSWVDHVPDDPLFAHPRNGARSAPLREGIHGGKNTLQCTNFEMTEDSPIGMLQFLENAAQIIADLDQQISSPAHGGGGARRRTGTSTTSTGGGVGRG